MRQMRRRVRDFISSELQQTPKDRRRQAIQEFATTLTGMTIDQQDKLVAYFASCFTSTGDASGAQLRHFIPVPVDYSLFPNHCAQVVFIVDKLARLSTPKETSHAIWCLVQAKLPALTLPQRRYLAHEIPWHIASCRKREWIAVMFASTLCLCLSDVQGLLLKNEDEFDDEIIAAAHNCARGDTSLIPGSCDAVEIEIELVQGRSNYPDFDWSLGEEDNFEVEAFVEDFVWLELSTRAASEHERSIESWAKSWPPGMTQDQQAHVGNAFESALEYHQLPPDFSDSLYRNLRDPLDLNPSEEAPGGTGEDGNAAASEDEGTVDEGTDDEGTDDDDDDDDDFTAPVHNLPSWFQPNLSKEQYLHPLHIPSCFPEVQGFQTPNEMHDWIRDAPTVMIGFEKLRRQLESMVTEGPNLQGDETESIVHLSLLILREVSDNLQSAFVFGSATLSPADDPSEEGMSFSRAALRQYFRDRLERVQLFLPQVPSHISIIERYLAKQEKSFLSTNNMKFIGYASRYERCKYRCSAKSTAAQLRTPRLRQLFFMPSTKQPEPVARPHKEEDECPICHEVLQGEVGSTSPPAVTYRCCNKPFHVDCLLEYMFGKVPMEVITCPMCRTSLDLEFLSEVMEMKVRERKCL